MKTLQAKEPEPIARINPQDAQRADISDGEVIKVCNDRGHVLIKCRFDDVRC